MAANCTGRFWDALARETRRLGHLYSPGAQRGPWPWFQYALDNGCYALWDPIANVFDEEAWLARGVTAWRHLLFWAGLNDQKPLWVVVPDRPGDAAETFRKWELHAGEVLAAGFKLALAVQDGMTVEDVKALAIQPDVICVGGSTAWKWETVAMWAAAFDRVHLLRCNSPERLKDLEAMGVESCDGTGWLRGDVKQTRGLEEFLRGSLAWTPWPLWKHLCGRNERKAQRQSKGQPKQTSFA